jgi:hypothetical protein
MRVRVRMKVSPSSNMSADKKNLLDLPNEILHRVLKNLKNIDVLYSLLGIDNQRLNIIVKQQIFTNNHNFVSMSSNENIFSISDTILDRFCFEILPRIHHNVKSFTLESVSIERILLAANYPNLTKRKLFNFNRQIVSRYFKGKYLMCSTVFQDWHTRITKSKDYICFILFR